MQDKATTEHKYIKKPHNTTHSNSIEQLNTAQ